jgi:hypothetical protein
MGFCGEEYGYSSSVWTGKIHTQCFSVPPEVGDIPENDWHSLWGEIVDLSLKYLIYWLELWHDRMNLRNQWVSQVKLHGSHLMVTRLLTRTCAWSCWPESSTKIAVLTCHPKSKQ